MTDLRHLVGMSMSARKRAARLTAFLSSVPKLRVQRRRMLRMFRRDRLGELLADEYHAARAHYRIGERLRPCGGRVMGATHAAGCCDCRGEATFWFCGPYLRMRVNGCQEPHCDGTGVIPARKKCSP